MRRTTAVICEFNPIHLGHRHLLKLAGAGGEAVISVMSGHFTQRGIPALFDKYARAEAAVRCGADLVVELPYPWCASGAEDFARGGCAIAAALGADSMTFGSETGDLSMLARGAEIRASEEFRLRMRETERSVRDGGSGALYESVMRAFGIEPGGGNDRLGIEYIRFGRASGIGDFRPVKRMTGVPSASELRAAYRAGGMEALYPLLAEEAAEVFARAVVCPEEGLERLLFAHARLYLGESEDNALLRYAARLSKTVSDPAAFFERLPTKKYTAARMKRELLRSLIGAGEPGEDPRFTVLLAANDRGRELLSELRRREGALPVIVKPADTAPLDPDPAAERQYALNRRADEVYAYLSGLESGAWMKKGPAIL